VGSALARTAADPDKVAGLISVNAGFFWSLDYETVGDSGISPIGSSRLLDTHEKRLVVDGIYGLTKEWLLQVSLPVRSISVDSPDISYTAFGDPELRGHYIICMSPLLFVSAGVTLPMGDTSVTYDLHGTQMRADDYLQPGYGTVDPLLGVFWLHKFGDTVSVSVNAGGRFGIDDNSYGYRFGSVVDVTASVSAQVNEIELSCSVSAVHSEPDKQNGQDVISTGGDIFYVMPGMQFKITENLSGRLADQIRIGTSVEGQMMLPRHTLAAGVSGVF
jgi:hypothetical protein